MTLPLLCHGAQPEERASPSATSVAAFGAKGDGETKDTAAIQKAIDACAERGGGTVHFPPGTYLSGSLHLKSGVTLYLGAGATLMGSKDQADYDPYEKLDFKNAADRETSFFHFALIWGEGVEGIGILGPGTIDANRDRRGGPKPIALKRCRRVAIQGITIRNAPNYNISMLGTDDVHIEGVTILNGYCDGIDPDACHNVTIANCHIESWDDAIVLKTSYSLGEHRSTENVTVTNCLLATACNAFKLGTESGGDFKRIALSNCVMFRLGSEQPAIGGIALESVDGSNIDGVVVSNVTMVDVRSPIFLRLGNRGRDMPTPTAGTLRNVLISNVTATAASVTCSITGIPDHPIEGVTLSNIRITYQGGDSDMKLVEDPPEKIADYPDADMFRGLPAWGLYCRHVQGLRLSGVQLSYDPLARWRITDELSAMRKKGWVKDSAGPYPESLRGDGPALVCDDVGNLELEGFAPQPALAEGSSSATPPGSALIRFVNVRDALVRGCLAPRGTDLFLQVRGAATRGVSLLGNDLSRAQHPLGFGEGATPGEVILIDNREK